MWANAVEGSLKRPEQLDQPPPQVFKEAIDLLFIEGPFQEHRSGHNEQYPLRAMANSWIGGVPLSDLSIRHFALWRDERLLQVKPNTIMRKLRILRVLLDIDLIEQKKMLDSINFVFMTCVTLPSARCGLIDLIKHISIGFEGVN